MRLYKEKELYVFDCDSARKHIPQQAGFGWWRARNGHWATKSPFVASQLSEYADPEIRPELAQAIQMQRFMRTASAAGEYDGDKFPSPEGMEYLPFQEAGIAFLKGCKGAFLADEMGLGKTIEAIGLLNCTDSNKILIVCPSSLKLNWRDELDKWLCKDLPVTVITPSTKQFDCEGIVIMNYDIIKKHKEAILSLTWDVVIADESHAIKNARSNRTRVFTKLKAIRKILITGTPILNRPDELYTSLKWLDKETWGNWHYFVRRYCGAKQQYGRLDTSGATNLRELNYKLRSHCMLRRRKKDVMKDLPPKFRQVIEIPCDNPELIGREQLAWKSVGNEIAALRHVASEALASSDQSDYDNAVQRLNSKVVYQFREIAKVRKETAVYKVPHVISHLQACLEDGRKVVCFAHHRDVVDAIHMAFHNISVKLYGGMSDEEKYSAVKSFQEDENVRLFVGSIKAAGVGLTLTSSHHCVFIELDWTPAIVTQAEDRTHRKGQLENVLIQHLVLEGSLDSQVAKKMVAKQKIIDESLDGQVADMESNLIVIPEGE